MLLSHCVCNVARVCTMALSREASGAPFIVNTGEGSREGLGQKFNILPWSASERFCFYQLGEQAFKLRTQKPFLFDFSWAGVTSVLLSQEVLQIQLTGGGSRRYSSQKGPAASSIQRL